MNKLFTVALVAAVALTGGGTAASATDQVTSAAPTVATAGSELSLFKMTLGPAVPLSDIEEQLLATPVHIEAVEHVGASTGVMHPGGDDLKTALRMYRVSTIEHFGTEPLISSIEFRAQSGTDLVLPEVATTVTVVDEAALAAIVAGHGSQESSTVGELGAADGDVTSASTANPWAPSEGLIRGVNDPLSAGYPRQMVHRHMWNSRAGLDSYDDFAYEHDMKLYDYGAGGTRPYCTNNNFWAVRGNEPEEGGSTFVSSNMPPSAGIYLDTDLSDSCETMDFSWGIYHPGKLSVGVSYKTVVGAQRGSRASSIFELSGQRLSNDCQLLPDNPNCIGLNTRRAGSGSQLYVNDTRAWRLPDCYNWLRGESPTRTC